jgi:hypothetical protein
MVEIGYQFVTSASDARLMVAKAQEVVSEMRAGLKRTAAASAPQESY